ncbi:hypothetical protein [Caproiciproducens sp.]|uniref:hypothetical protein n=1 Tax=Caproiciproducens sp. TaxID=1954376 RepID=UPI003FA41EFD
MQEQQYPQPPMTMPQFEPIQTYRFNQNTDATADARSAMIMPDDPPPRLSNNRVTANVVLFKELTAYPNYGNPSRNADILYTGNVGTWTFESPAFLFVPGNQRAQIRIRAVLDDHANVPVNRYSARITINGVVVHNGRVALDHGTPVGGMFTNWRDLPFAITNLRRNTRVTIENTSAAGADDWIALDWMEIRFLPR